MAHRRAIQEFKSLRNSSSSPQDRLQSQLKTFIAQKQYPQAIEKLKQIRNQYPDVKLDTSEVNLLLLQGQQEYGQGNYRQAEKIFQQTLELGAQSEGYYWIAKCLLALDKPDSALELMRNAFESKELSKDYAGCYLKLLFLQGQSETVTNLVNTQSKRFCAPQLHWARGILALQADNFREAIAHFQKMGRTATPGDHLTAWTAYAQQKAGQWDLADMTLGLGQLRSFRISPGGSSKHPAIQRLMLAQAVHQQKSLVQTIPLPAADDPQQTLMLVLQILHYIEEKNYSDAAILLLEGIDRPCREFPELDAIAHNLLLLGGEQAFREQDAETVEECWSEIIYHPPFDPNLALKLHLVYCQTDEDQEHRKLLKYLLDWLVKEARANPQVWPEPRLKATQAKIQCWITDIWMSMGQHSQGHKALQEAEKLCPDSPEVIGRQGLTAFVKGKSSQAIPLLTRALEGGCRYAEVYEHLIEILEEQGDQTAVKEARQRFGQNFGDVSPELDSEQPRWIEALATQNYFAFEQLVMSDRPDNCPALEACRIFVRATAGGFTSTGRVGLKQEQATKQWDKLLAGLSPQDQIPVLQAIFLTLQLFTKRQKGLAALQTQYQKRLFVLAEQYPEAKAASLVLLVVKGTSPDERTAALKGYLEGSPHPGTALAQIQLKARHFVQTNLLRSPIDDQLKREPQNPHLLLAKATTYPFRSADYERFHNQGFELARRLQDAQALQAFREEEVFQSGMMAGELLPDFLNLEASGQLNMTDMVRKMVQKMFGKELPPDVLEEMLPELVKMATAGMPELDFDDGFDDDFDFFAEIPPGRQRSPAKSKASNRKRRFPF